MIKDPKIFLKHILEAVEIIESHLKGIDFEKFKKDIKSQDAVVRRIEIIGEATKNIPESIKNNYPELVWKDIAGMRDILIHRYYGVDLEITWEVIQKDLPKLKKGIEKILLE